MMKLPPGYRAERISKDNFSDFIRIHREAFRSKIKSDFPSRKFNTIPVAGISNIGYIIYFSDGEPVAYYGVYPVYAVINDKKILTAQSGDTMTILSHTGLGLFICTAEMTWELCKQNKIKGVFGFSSPSSYRTTRKKLGWQFNGVLMKYTFILPALPLGYIAEKNPYLKTPYLWWVRLILSFYKKTDFFEGSVTTNGQDGVHRSKAFWDYKMSSRDNFAVRICGTDVVFKVNGALTIGDIDINRESDIIPILRKLKILAFLTLNAHIIFCMSPGTLLDEKLSKIKEGVGSLPIGFLNLNEDYDLSSLKFTYFDFDTF
jgi:hypothetical protein